MSDIIQNPSNAVVTQTVVAKHNAMLSSLREIISEHKDLIGYREYVQVNTRAVFFFDFILSNDMPFL